MDLHLDHGLGRDRLSAGTVVAVNDALSDDPEVINNDPYGDGWIVRLEPGGDEGGGGGEGGGGLFGGFLVRRHGGVGQDQLLGVRRLLVHRDAHVIDHVDDIFDLLRIDDVVGEVVVESAGGSVVELGRAVVVVVSAGGSPATSMIVMNRMTTTARPPTNHPRCERVRSVRVSRRVPMETSAG